jgi:phosphoribosylanthranilate isomerase
VSVRIKICGVTVAGDAAQAAALGADFLGLNFWPRSKRYLDPQRAPELVAAARAAGACRLVGVFVNASADEIAAIHGAVGLDVVQLHGDEPPGEVAAIAARLSPAGVDVWKAVAAGELAAVEKLDEWEVAAILLDAPSAGRGGSGLTIDAAVVRHARQRHPARRLVLAGGMRPDNVAEAIAQTRPWAVDTASGVESSPGIKDAAKMKAFVRAVRSGDVEIGGGVLPDGHG